MARAIDMHAIYPFDRVHEVHQNDWERDGYKSVALIVPDTTSGSKGRYHVYRLDLKRKTIKRIGCELPLPIARAVAKRPMAGDWQPLSKAELREGRSRT